MLVKHKNGRKSDQEGRTELSTISYRSTGFDGMTWNKPRALDAILAKQLQDAWRSNRTKLSTGERGRGRLATIDPQGEGIEIKGETNSTSHTNADTVAPSPVPERESKLCPPFFWASKRIIVICS